MINQKLWRRDWKPIKNTHNLYLTSTGIHLTTTGIHFDYQYTIINTWTILNYLYTIINTWTIFIILLSTHGQYSFTRIHLRSYSIQYFILSPEDALHKLYLHLCQHLGNNCNVNNRKLKDRSFQSNPADITCS